MRTRNASLRAGELTALAAGALGFDLNDRHDGHGRVLARGERAADRERQRDFGASNEQGEVEVPFRITGSMDSPAFAINTEALLGRAIRKEIDRNIRKGLDRFLRRP